jgi:hypothetical protein
MVLKTNTFSADRGTDGIGLAAASVAVGTETIIVLAGAGSIAERPSLIVPAWESDTHRATPIVVPTLRDHRLVQR